LFGGGHENERRAGTENVAAIIGLTEAIERFVKKPVFAPEKLHPLTDRLAKAAAAISGVQIRSPKERLANTISFTVDGCDSIALMAGLDLEGVCASSGSACSAGSLEPSHVISALGMRGLANSLVRFSLGRESTLAEVECVEQVLPRIIRRTQRRPEMVR